MVVAKEGYEKIIKTYKRKTECAMIKTLVKN